MLEKCAYFQKDSPNIVLMSGVTSCEEGNWNSILFNKTATSSGMFQHNIPKLGARDGSGTVQDIFHGVDGVYFDSKCV